MNQFVKYGAIVSVLVIIFIIFSFTCLHNVQSEATTNNKFTDEYTESSISSLTELPVSSLNHVESSNNDKLNDYNTPYNFYETNTTKTTQPNVNTSEISPTFSDNENCEKMDELKPFKNIYNCTTSGLFADESDPNHKQYIVCARNGNSFITLYLKCPDGNYFDTNISDCMVEATVPITILTTTKEIGKSTETNTHTTETTETSQEVCSFYISDPDYLTCTTKGRFPNNNDVTCSSYYLCSQLRSGLFLKTKYSCPTNSYFNPPQQLCDVDYICPCQQTTRTINNSTATSTTEEITQTPDKGSTSITASTKGITSTETTTIKSTTELVTSPTVAQDTSTTEILTTSTKLPSPTTDTTAPSQEICSFYISDPDYFTCTTKGRFPNNNDVTCTSYYLCSQLRSGLFLKTKYSCPTNSYFNPPQQLCDVDYICPCQQTTTTINFSTVTSTTEEITQTPDKGSTSITASTKGITSTETTTIKSTTEIVTSPTVAQDTSTTELLTTSTKLPSPATDTTEPNQEICSFYISDPDYFTCTTKGRFPNNNDVTCTSYYLCSQLRSGLFLKTKYSCPTNSYFNPPQQLCDVDYICPCQQTTTTINNSIVTSTTEEITQTPDKGSTSITASTEGITSTETTTIKSTTELVTSHTVAQDTSTTEILTTSTKLPSPTTDTTAPSQEICSFYISDPDYFTCTNKGRFPNNNDLTCTSYYLCSQLRSGLFLKTKYSCPTNSYFNPPEQLCDVDYICPCQQTTTTINNSTVTSTTEEITQTPDKGSTSTTASTEGITSTEQTTIKSTTEIATSPTVAQDTSTTELLTTSTELPSSTTDTTEPSQEICSFYISDSDYFTCTTKGRFPNNNDVTCTSYYLCSQLRSGLFLKTKYSCPTNSYFNPPQQLCDVDYFCPCQQTTTTINYSTVTSTIKEITQTPDKGSTSTTASTEGITSTEQTTIKSTTEIVTSPTVAQDTSTTELLTTSTELPSPTTDATGPTQEICSFYISDPDYFTCTTKGRFPNNNDVTCTSYYLCSQLRSGLFLKTKYSCPTNSYFNPPQQLCDVDYICPCQQTTTTINYSTVTSTTGEITQTPDKGSTSTTALTEGITSTSTIKSTTEIVTSSTVAQDTSTTELLTTSTELPSPTTDATGPTQEICSFYISDPDYFTCTTKGRFPNNNDVTCSSYFLCDQLRSGLFLKTKYSCPTNSYFNPPDQLCDLDYICPCQQITTTTNNSTVTSTTEEITQTPDKGSTSITASTEEITCTETTTIKSTTEIVTSPTVAQDNSTTEILTTSTKLTSPTTDTTEPSQEICSFYIGDPDYFTCTIKGRFPNNNDVTCSSYYLCSQLRSGLFLKTKYSCPTNSYFNPPQQLCDVDYICPCQQTTTTINYSTVTSTIKEITQAPDKGSTSTTASTEGITSTDQTTIKSTTEIVTSPTVAQDTSTTELLTTSTELPSPTTDATGPTQEICSFYISDPDYFTCTTKGRFPNNNDVTCTSYYLCSQLRSGLFLKTKYSCPTNSYFKTPQQLCDVDYICPCQQTTTTINYSTVTSTTEEITQTPDKDSTSTTASTEGITSTEQTTIKSTTEIVTSPTVAQDTSTTELLTTSTKLPSPTTDTTEPSQDICSFYIGDPDYFTCTTKGRFPNNNDVTCSSYYLCSQLRSGLFLKTMYSCPTNSYFNPPQQLCDVDYICPCQQTTTTINNSIASSTTEEITQTPDKGSTTITASTEEITSTETTTIKSTTEIVTSPTVAQDTSTTETLSTSTKLTSPTTDTTEPSQDICSFYIGDPDYFTCTTKGRFPNNNDVTCSSYYLCSQLRSGLFLKTKYSCPTNSYFNPPQQLCDVDYICPCQQTSTTINYSTVTSTIKEITQTPDKGSTSTRASTEGITSTEQTTIKSTTEIVTSPTVAQDTSTTELLTTSTELPSPTTDATGPTQEICSFYISDPDYFTCTTKGRFPNNNDLTCTSYYLCSQLRSGLFLKTKYSCPTNSYFNPPQQLCDVDYICPCQQTTTTINYSTVTSTTEEITQTPDKGSTSTTASTEGITSTEQTTIKSTTEIVTSPTVAQDTSTTELLTTSTKLPSPTTDTTEPSQDICSFYIGDPDYFTCTTKGRFSNNNDVTCSSYYLCSQLRSGLFLKTMYSCPTNSYFNPPQQLCDVDYICPCQQTTTTINNSIASSTTEEITQTPDKGSTTITASTEEITSTETTTIKSTTEIVTSPTVAQDTSTTETLSTSTKLTSPTTDTTEPSQDICSFYIGDPDYFTCTTKGRFPNNNDVTCSSYYLCSQLRSGLFLKTKYSCPRNSYFNPPQQLCDVDYICPCQQTSTTINYSTVTSTIKEITQTPDKGSTSTRASTEGITSTEQTTIKSTTEIVTSPTVAQDTSTTELLTTSTELLSPTTDATGPTQEICSFYISDPDYFTCTTKGRFPNNNDLTCTSYYLCSQLRSGLFLKTKYSCPTNSYFNPPQQLCDVDYICPCQQTTTTINYSTVTSTTEEITQTPDKGSTSTTASTEGRTSTEQTTIKSTTEIETSPTVAQDTSTTELLTTSTKLPSPTTDTTEPSQEICSFYISDPDYFTCTTKGRFSNNNDVTCTSYYLCSQLKSGLFLKTKYSCPTNSYFNPPQQLCDVDYICPCQQTTTTINYSTVTSTRGEITQTPDKGSTSTTALTEGITSTEQTTIKSTTEIETSPTVAQDTSTTELLTTSTKLPSPTTDTTEPSQEICSFYISDPDYFTCTTKGRFSNNNDVTCTSYYLCSQLKSGLFLKTKYSCPTNSYFNPPQQLCDVDYICPCQQTTTTINYSTVTSTRGEITQTPDKGSTSTTALTEGITSTEQTTIKSITEIVTSPTVAQDTSTTELLTTSTELPSPTTDATGPTQEICSFYISDPDYFTCTTKGRFPNNNDVTCSSYFLCDQLRSGLFLKTKYSCPTNSYFNPPDQLCDLDYICPCQQITTTTNNSTVTSTTEEITQTPDKGSTSITASTEEITSTETTTIKSTTEIVTSPTVAQDTSTTEILTTSTTLTSPTTDTTEPSQEICPFYIGDPDYFTCTTKGRFPNNNDVTCSSYYLCSQLRSGLFLKTMYSCPTNSYFNPPQQLCDVDYICPCQQTTTTINNSTVTSTIKEITQTPDKGSTSTTASTEGITSTEQTTIKSTTEIVTSPTVAQDTSTTEIFTISTELPSSTTDTTKPTHEICSFYISDPDYFSCTTKGRFPNNNDVTCSSYFLCNQLRSGLFLKTKYSCPTNSYFNPPDQLCDVDYICPCQKTTATINNSTVTSTTEEITQTPDKSSTSTTASTEGIPSTETTTIKSTSEIVTSPTIAQDTSTTETLTTSTELPSPTADTTKPSQEICSFYISDPDYFTCTTKGRFPNNNDVTCSSYFLCNQFRSGLFLKTKYLCPINSYFNPTKQLCDVEYICPCQELSTSSSRVQ